MGAADQSCQSVLLSLLMAVPYYCQWQFLWDDSIEIVQLCLRFIACLLQVDGAHRGCL